VLGRYDHGQFDLDAFESLLRCHIPSLPRVKPRVVHRPGVIYDNMANTEFCSLRLLGLRYGHVIQLPSPGKTVVGAGAK
jgi:hypothetical protein